MAIQGLRDTSNFVTNQRPQNWQQSILLLYPNGKAPLTALTALMKKRVTDDPQFNWWEKGFPTQRLALGANIGDSSTTITLTTGTTGTALQLKDGHLLYVEQTGEIMLVNGDPSSAGSVNVVRGYAGTTATSFAYATGGTNPNLTVIGSAYEEGSEAPTGVNYDPTQKSNYTQIFRNTLEMTRTAQNTRLRTGDQVREAKRECLELHTVEMERAFWLGQSTSTTRNGKPLKTTGGVYSFVAAANIVTATSATLNMTQLEGHLKNAFAYGSSEKMCFLGNTAMLTIQQIIRRNSSYQIMMGLKEFGMNVSRLVTPFGELILKTHPLFNLLSGGTTGSDSYYGIDSWMWILDMNEITYVYLTDGNTKYEKNLQSNGVDGMKSGYLTECGLQVNHPTAHFVIKNVATAATD